MFHVDLVSEFLLDLTWTLSRGKQGSQVCINQGNYSSGSNHLLQAVLVLPLGVLWKSEVFARLYAYYPNLE